MYLSLKNPHFFYAIFLTQLTKYYSVLVATLVPISPCHNLPLVRALGLGQNLLEKVSRKVNARSSKVKAHLLSLPNFFSIPQFFLEGCIFHDEFTQEELPHLIVKE